MRRRPLASGALAAVAVVTLFVTGSRPAKSPGALPKANGTDTFACSQDVFVATGDWADHDANYSARDYIAAGEESCQEPIALHRAYVQFDISALPSGITITSAQLRLKAMQRNRCAPPDDKWPVITAYQVMGSWSQSTLTWNTQPPVGSVVGGPVTLDTPDTVIDVTPAVEAWYYAASSNRGLRLDQTGDISWVAWASKEHSEPLWWPVLEVTYTGGQPGIHGKVTENGSAASGVSLGLMFYDGSSPWTTIDTTMTDPDGKYLLTGVPTLGPNQRYSVRYSNPTCAQDGRLNGWWGGLIESYTAGTPTWGGDFDIADVQFFSQPDGETVSLPHTFYWNRRPFTPEDDYEFNLADRTDYDPGWFTEPSLGYAGFYTLDTLPTGFTAGKEYEWYLWIKGRGLPWAGGFPCETRRVTFSGERNLEYLLAERFAPILVPYDSANDPFVPEEIGVMVNGSSTLRSTQDSGFSEPVTIDNLYQYSDDHYYIDLPGRNDGGLAENYITPYSAVLSDQYETVTYARVTSDEGHLVLQYWFFYYYNYFYNEPIVINRHEGDWEMIQLMFEGGDLETILDGHEKPKSAAYSGHLRGRLRLWELVQTPDQKPDRPEVYVAEGSHASYFEAGSFCNYGCAADVTRRAGKPSEPVVVLMPHDTERGDLQGTPFAWLSFEGEWGEHGGAGEKGPLGPQFQPEIPLLGNKWSSPYVWGQMLSLDLPGEWRRELCIGKLSPADLHLYDAQGRHVGPDGMGGIDLEIPGSNYAEPEGTDRAVITISNADISAETYTIEIDGTGAGPLNLVISVPDQQDGVKYDVVHSPISVTVDFAGRVTLGSDADFTMEIDSDGDGTYEDSQPPATIDETRWYRGYLPLTCKRY